VNDDTMPSGSEPDDARLRALAALLGAQAAQRIDADLVARRVVERLRRPVAVPLPRRVHRVVPVWLRLAAVLMVLAGAGVAARALLLHPAPLTQFVTADLAGLDVDELSELLSTLDQTLSEARDPAPGGLDELDVDQLDRVLRGLDG